MMMPASQQTGSGGILAEVDRDTFLSILGMTEKPLVVVTRSGLPQRYRYVTQYGGFYFRLKTKEEQDLSRHAHVVPVQKLRSVGDPMTL